MLFISSPQIDTILRGHYPVINLHQTLQTHRYYPSTRKILYCSLVNARELRISPKLQANVRQFEAQRDAAWKGINIQLNGAVFTHDNRGGTEWVNSISFCYELNLETSYLLRGKPLRHLAAVAQMLDKNLFGCSAKRISGMVKKTTNTE